MNSIGFEDFDLDARNYRLRRFGQDVKLERIPLELLLLLADHAGEVVTREVRLALGDDPAQPRYVQTVTGKGYRFIARIADSAPPIVVTPEEPEGRVARAESRGSRRRVVFVTGSAACLLALGITFTRWNATLPQASNYVQITNDGHPKTGPLLTDGLRLYFTEGSQNHRSLMQVSASGGESTALTSPLETPHLMDIAPNRSDLLIGLGEPSSSALWMVSLPASGLRRMGDVQAEDATWFPVGREVAYVRGKDLYRARNDGAEGRKLATFPGIPPGPDGLRTEVVSA
jgi:DNA-binding winged helix-turn-helix (wHTH) protein